MKQLYSWIGRVLFYFAYPGLSIWSNSRPNTRVRVIVVSEKGTILLVKTWFGKQRWSLPGGGIAKGESPQRAAVRELYEEAAIRASVRELEYVGEFAGGEELPFRLKVYKLFVSHEQLRPLPKGRNFEIVDRLWVDPRQLPARISAVVAWAVARLD